MLLLFRGRDIKLKFIILFSFIFAFSAFGFQSYVVKDGDTVSKILYKHNLKPIYGKNGSLTEFFKLNKEFNGLADKIFPKMIIKLPEDHQMTSSNDNFPLEIKENQIKKEDTVSDISYFKVSSFTLNTGLLSAKLTTTNLQTNDKVTFISKSGYGVGGKVDLVFKNEINLFIFGELNHYSINDNSARSMTLSGSEQNLIKYGLGGQLHLSQSVGLWASLSRVQNLVGKSISTTRFQLENITTTQLTLGTEKVIKEFKHFSLFAAGNIRLAFPESENGFKTKLSNGYQLGLGSINKVKSFSLKSEIFYRSLILKDKLAEFDQTEAGFGVSLIHIFDETNVEN